MFRQSQIDFDKREDLIMGFQIYLEDVKTKDRYHIKANRNFKMIVCIKYKMYENNG